MSLTALRRPVGALLALTMAATGCEAVRVTEHRSTSTAVRVRVVWDDDGHARLVGGVNVSLFRVDSGAPGLVATRPTRADAPLVFDELEPGRYRVALFARGQTIDRTFTVRAGRRTSVRVEVDAFEQPPGPDEGDGPSVAPSAARLADGALSVLKGVGVVVGVVAVVGLVFLLVAVSSDDDDGEQR